MIRSGASRWHRLRAHEPAGLRHHIIPGPTPPRPAFRGLRAAEGAWSRAGLDMTSDGVVWTPLASGHVASFDQRKCKGL